jgi:hypothetical protein
MMTGRLTTLLCLGTMAMGFAPAEKWLGFPEYPGARDLCNEFVLGQGDKGRVEIHWRSFATRDKTTDVIAFYIRREGKNVETKADTLQVRHGADHILSVYPSSKTGVPGCSAKPLADEKTLIMVSVRR